METGLAWMVGYLSGSEADARAEAGPAMKVCRDLALGQVLGPLNRTLPEWMWGRVYQTLAVATMASQVLRASSLGDKPIELRRVRLVPM